MGRTVFGRDLAGYHRARFDYPSELFELIGNRVQAKAILEIGAGTGLATSGLIGLKPDLLVAMEPDPQLAAFLRSRFCDVVAVRCEAFANADLDRQFDLVVAASSFHRLEPETALARVKSVLVPDGVLALWWNVYRQAGSGDEFGDAVAPLLRQIAVSPSENATGHYGLDVDFHRAQLTAAGFNDIQYRLFQREATLDVDGVRALFGSYSFVITLPGEERERLLDALSDLVETKFGGRAPMRLLTPFYLASMN